MARYFHSGEDISSPAITEQTINGREVVGLTVPPLFRRFTNGPFYECPQGSIAFGLHDVGFFVVPPKHRDGGPGYVDISNDVPEKAVKAVAPHLLTEREAEKAGLVKRVVYEAVTDKQPAPKAGK